MEARSDELGNLLACEDSKHLGEATADVRRAVQILDFLQQKCCAIQAQSWTGCDPV